MVKKRTIYTASDGKEFNNEKEAEEHDKKVIRESIKVYKVYYNPDLNEGRGYGDHGYVYVHANKYHEQFLEYFLCKRFGNPISFVMGTFGSNAIMQTYTYLEVPESDVKADKILARIEEVFVDKLWNKEDNCYAPF